MWVGSTADAFSEKRFKNRVRTISIAFIIGYCFIIFRLFHLQVIKGDDLSEVSESNRTNVIFLRAPRGIFYDRKGQVLISNRPTWSLMYSVPKDSDLTRGRIEKRLEPFLEQFRKPWKKRLRRAFKTKQMVRLVEDVPDKIAFGMREMGELLPGLRMEMEFRRGYPQGVLSSQLLGYLGEIDEKELRDSYWYARKQGDLIGKMGLEKILDNRLRGQDGGMLIEVDSFGRLKRVIRQLSYQKGNSVKVTLDSELQQAAQDLLANTQTKRGAIVLMDIETGAILTWASAPMFDPSGSLTEDLQDKKLPFFDRVSKGAYPPGSLFKIITAIAGFERGVINLKDKIICKGFVMLKDRRLKQRKYRCWTTHGEVNFWTSISESCDSYFYALGHKVGAQAIYEVGRQFGLGQNVPNFMPTDIAGNLPNPGWKRKKGLGGWSTGDTYNMSIGQGFITSSPLQMVVMMALVGARGEGVSPFVVEQVVDVNGNVTYAHEKPKKDRLDVKEETWDEILKSMAMVVNGGTGKAAYIRHLDVYGKTGTAQNPHGEDHAWFGGFAGYPNEKPKIAYCVFVEHGKGGGAVAAPIARKILEKALPKRNGPNKLLRSVS